MPWRVLILLFTFVAAAFAQKQDDFPPKPKWKPNIRIDISSIADRASYYTDKKAIVVIFRNGTCVVLAADLVNPEEKAKGVLDRVYKYHPDFTPNTMDDGNFMVSYSQRNCFSVVTKKEFENNREYIRKNHLDGIVKDEVLLNSNRKAAAFDDRSMIGLFARARMFMDAEVPEVVQIVRPQMVGNIMK